MVRNDSAPEFLQFKLNLLLQLFQLEKFLKWRGRLNHYLAKFDNGLLEWLNLRLADYLRPHLWRQRIKQMLVLNKILLEPDVHNLTFVKFKLDSRVYWIQAAWLAT